MAEYLVSLRGDFPVLLRQVFVFISRTGSFTNFSNISKTFLCFCHGVVSFGSNGNALRSQKGFAMFHDPWPKPSYLFALFAGAQFSISPCPFFIISSLKKESFPPHYFPGDLAMVEDTFKTKSGKDVSFRIFVPHRCEDMGKVFDI